MQTNLKLVRFGVGCALTIAVTIVSVVAQAAVLSAPLSISGITHEQFGPRPGCPSQFGGTNTGTGLSPLLGKVLIEANDCVIPIGNSLSFSGKMIFTMLSGDEIFADYGGSLTPRSYPSIFTLTGSLFDIKGGTGNFLNATGHGTLQGTEYIIQGADPTTVTGLGLMQATGTISNFTNSKNYSEPKAAYQNMAGATDPLSAIAGLNTSSISSSTTALGNYFYQDQNGLSLAVNPLPASSSWSLLVIGLASLAVIRRRKLVAASSS